MSGNRASWTPLRRAQQADVMRRLQTDPEFIGAAKRGRQNWTPERRAAKAAELAALNKDPAFRAKRRDGIARRKPRGMLVPDHAHPCVRGLFIRANAEQATRGAITERAGLCRTILDGWRTRWMPRLDLLDAALNALDLELAIVPIGSRDQDGFLIRKRGGRPSCR